MKSGIIKTVSELRLTVGYLGERAQMNWWPSAFLSSASKSFLSPVFSKTTVLAQCRGVTNAAARVHDERIGVGNVFHLFRLPEDMEQAIHRLFEEQEVAHGLLSSIKDKDCALAVLKSISAGKNLSTAGPVRVGRIDDLIAHDSWRAVAANYAAGFQSLSGVFPFFTAK